MKEKSFWSPVKPNKRIKPIKLFGYEMNNYPRNNLNRLPRAPVTPILLNKISIVTPVLIGNSRKYVRVAKKNLTTKQAFIKYPTMNPFGDIDKDSVPNWIDCRPFDKKRHSVSSKKEAKELVDKRKDEFGRAKIINEKDIQRLLAKKHRLRALVKEEKIKIGTKMMDPGLGGEYNVETRELSINKLQPLKGDITGGIVHELTHAKQVREGKIKYEGIPDIPVRKIRFDTSGKILVGSVGSDKYIANRYELEKEAREREAGYKKEFQSPPASPAAIPAAIPDTLPTSIMKEFPPGQEFYLVSGRRFKSRSRRKAGFYNPKVTPSKAVASALLPLVMPPTWNYAPKTIEDTKRTIYTIKSKVPITAETVIKPNPKIKVGYGTEGALPVLGKEELAKLGFAPANETKKTLMIPIQKLKRVKNMEKFSLEAAKEAIRNPLVDLGDYMKRLGKRSLERAKWGKEGMVLPTEKEKKSRWINQQNPKKEWSGRVPEKDDFGVPITDVFIDAKTKMGPWATMTPESFEKYGTGELGIGYGQAYKKVTEEGKERELKSVEEAKWDKKAMVLPKKEKEKIDPYKFQDTNQEKVIHSGWQKGNVYRNILEGTGDIFRESAMNINKPHQFVDPQYVGEKVSRIKNYFKDIDKMKGVWEEDYKLYKKKIEEARGNPEEEKKIEYYKRYMDLAEKGIKTQIHPEDSFEAAIEAHPEKINKMIKLWKKQPVQTKLQENARQLNIAMLKKDFDTAKKIIPKIEEAMKSQMTAVEPLESTKEKVKEEDKKLTEEAVSKKDWIKDYSDKRAKVAGLNLAFKKWDKKAMVLPSSRLPKGRVIIAKIKSKKAYEKLQEAKDKFKEFTNETSFRDIEEARMWVEEKERKAKEASNEYAFAVNDWINPKKKEYEKSAQELIDEVSDIKDVQDLDEQEPSQDVVEDMVESTAADDTTPYEGSAQQLIDEA